MNDQTQTSTTPRTVTMTREQFLRLDPHYRTAIDAPELRARQLPDGTILREAAAVILAGGTPLDCPLCEGTGDDLSMDASGGGPAACPRCGGSGIASQAPASTTPRTGAALIQTADTLKCDSCNGVLAAALLAEMTPEKLAHRLQHELADNAELRAALAGLYELRSEIMNVAGKSQFSTGRARMVDAFTKARAALARVQS